MTGNPRRPFDSPLKVINHGHAVQAEQKTNPKQTKRQPLAEIKPVVVTKVKGKKPTKVEKANDEDLRNRNLK